MLRRTLLLALTVLAVLPASAAMAQDGLTTNSTYEGGPSGRYLMGGTWYHRLDLANVGLSQGFHKQTTTDGWGPVAVPHTWNPSDDSTESFLGGVGWYRKDFRLPSAKRALSWVVRFESVNYRSRIYLNGSLIGTNRGAYLPFEIRLPKSLLKRGAMNRLVIRVDSKRGGGDFPPSGLSTTGAPTGGWWNYGGLLREVYLRKIDKVDFNTVVVRPDLPCATCDATVLYRATLRNYGEGAVRVKVRARLGSRKVDLGTATIGPKKFATLDKRITVRNPRVWSPATPNLYDASFTASGGGGTIQRFKVRTGIRSVKVSPDGRILINGKQAQIRGFGMHEDSPDKGFAIANVEREQQIGWAREAGASMLRSHYPLHPYYHERADELGLLLWTESPIYAVRTKYLKQKLVRQLATRELESMVQTHQNHPSDIIWSIGNELSARPGPVQGYYISRAVRSIKALDPSRPVGYAVAGYPAAGCQPEYAPLDVIGINEYFGWYPGPNGQIADRTLLSDYLDGVRQCYPNKGIMVTEFGAEANRDGPVEEKGTYAHQQDFVNFHMGVLSSKPWLSGIIYWALQEFRVRPGWQGGNPRPSSPLHQKGLVFFDGRKKPAFFDLQRHFKAVAPLRSRGG